LFVQVKRSYARYGSATSPPFVSWTVSMATNDLGLDLGDYWIQQLLVSSLSTPSSMILWSSIASSSIIGPKQIYN